MSNLNLPKSPLINLPGLASLEDLQRRIKQLEMSFILVSAGAEIAIESVKDMLIEKGLIKEEEWHQAIKETVKRREGGKSHLAVPKEMLDQAEALKKAAESPKPVEKVSEPKTEESHD